MIRKAGNYESMIKEKMYAGSGDVKIEHFWKADELKANNRLFAKIIVQPGDSIGFHNHENEEEVFVITKGQAEANDNGEVSILNVGDTILTADGAGHSMKCLSKEPLEMIAVISCY